MSTDDWPSELLIFGNGGWHNGTAVGPDDDMAYYLRALLRDAGDPDTDPDKWADSNDWVRCEWNESRQRYEGIIWGHMDGKSESWEIYYTEDDIAYLPDRYLAPGEKLAE